MRLSVVLLQICLLGFCSVAACAIEVVAADVSGSQSCLVQGLFGPLIADTCINEPPGTLQLQIFPDAGDANVLAGEIDVIAVNTFGTYVLNPYQPLGVQAWQQLDPARLVKSPALLTGMYIYQPVTSAGMEIELGDLATHIGTDIYVGVRASPTALFKPNDFKLVWTVRPSIGNDIPAVDVKTNNK